METLPSKIIPLNQKMTMTIEPATIHDHEEIVAIENRTFAFPWSHNVLKSEINGESFSFAYVARLRTQADQPGKIIGYNFFWLVADEVHILNVAVDPEYQGMGCGKRLMRFAEQFGAERGAIVMFLEVRVSNTAAQNLYTGLGFHRIDRRKHYYSDNMEDAYVMKKEIMKN